MTWNQHPLACSDGIGYLRLAERRNRSAASARWPASDFRIWVNRRETRAARFSSQSTLEEFRPKLRCSRCGNKSNNGRELGRLDRMYNRYRIEMEFDELWHAARSQSDMTKRASPTMEVFPDKPGPVIRNNAYDQRELMNPTGACPRRRRLRLGRVVSFPPPSSSPGHYPCQPSPSASFGCWPSRCRFRWLAAKSLLALQAISQYLAETPHLQSLHRHPVPSSSRRRRNFTPAEHPRQMLSGGSGIILESGGDYFSESGARSFRNQGRIASEFASYPTTSYPSWA